MKKILITGSTGFVGKTLLKELNKEKYFIYSYSSKDGDISSKKTWERMPKSDYLIHLAAKTFVPDSWKKPEEFFIKNSIALINAIDYCKKNNSKLIFLSSFVYGNQNFAINEKCETLPQNPYSLSKLIGEQVCSFYKRVENLDVIILRPFNIFGPDQNKLFLIPKIINQIKNNFKIEVLDIKPKRDFLYVKDLASAIEKTLSYEGNHYIFNIGSGKSYSIEQIIKILQELYGTNLEVLTKNQTRKMEISETIADITLAKKELHWEPKYSIKAALKEMIDNKEK